MKKSIVLILVSALAAAFLFVGCQQPTNPAPGTAYVFDGVNVNKTDYTYLYIDLEDPGNPLSSGGNTDWDIRITGAKEILTNSGVTATAESSSGVGGVVFSGYTDFDTTISAAQAAVLFTPASGAEDYYYWEKSSSSSSSKQKTGNAISFPGYPALVEVDDPGTDRDGQSAATAWVFADDVDFSLGTAYCQWDRMAPNFRNYTYNVYVVRSGDGADYYKIQIVEASYLKETDTPTSGSTTYHYTYKINIEKLE